MMRRHGCPARQKPLVSVLSSAYAVLGLCIVPAVARATDYINPPGYTLTTPVLLSTTFGGGDTYTNYGTITSPYGGGLLLSNTTIGVVSNVGTIEATTGFAVDISHSTIGTVGSSGTLNGAEGFGLYSSRLQTLANSGTITSTDYGVGLDADSSVGTLVNSGSIRNGSYGISSRGTIGVLVNSGVLSGTLQAIYAYSGDLIPVVVNTGTIAGDILSTAAMTISGSGGTLTGLNGTAGTINVNGGVTFASGSQLLNDHIQVGAGHSVSNTGATLQVNQPLTITGNYRQTAGSTLVLGVSDSAHLDNLPSANSGYGRLVVSGAAVVGAGSSVQLTRTGSGYAFAGGQRYVVLTASDVSNSVFSGSATYSAVGFDGSVSASQMFSANTTNLVLSLIPRAPASSLATAPNAVSAFAGLGRYQGISGGLLNLYNAALAISSSGEANRVGAQLAPTQNASTGSAASTATLGVLAVVGQHADSMRHSGGSGIASGDSYADWQAWGQVYGGKASQGMIDGVSGYDADYNGVVAGADRLLGDRWRAGAAFSYGGTWVKGADSVSGNTSHVFAYGLIAYASYAGDPWYVNLSGSYNWQRYHSDRLVQFTGYSDRASADFDGNQSVLKAEAGYPLAGPFGSTITPLGALSYSRQHLDGYTESAANGSALKVGAAHVDAVRSSLGGKLEKSWTTRWGELTPAAQLLWSHQFNKGRMSVVSSYASDTTGDTSFVTQGATPVQDTADLSLGATLARGNALSVSLRYDRQDGAHYHAQTVSLRLRKQF